MRTLWIGAYPAAGTAPGTGEGIWRLHLDPGNGRLADAGPRQAAAHAHQTILAPGGRWVLVTDLGADRRGLPPLQPDHRTRLRGGRGLARARRAARPRTGPRPSRTVAATPRRPVCSRAEPLRTGRSRASGAPSAPRGRCGR
ncbi:beta-propeller fold lactonase family protein [Tessaracoccus defluvii]|uniref:Beta-propeller fold lactonase family protein n=1 Tax=Tessaracoccus defluvii TaxID=1285901 RepID=A0A7H0H824_9ACTN|nr:beta-propeller fold lactonase family protein [Tessaracoccus defluvii]